MQSQFGTYMLLHIQNVMSYNDI
ncbi:hypothetical protein MADA3029_270081 [Vibrio nigripulchritudo MADA3029]|nr:hypothetical protein VIBNIMADA3020_420081 [Vibrio nigripulchritudo MADA3020]CCN58844.1 hypothetical protein MADA3029_270081 [Vibrio nigripulchritudo MADA3029]